MAPTSNDYDGLAAHHCSTGTVRVFVVTPAGVAREVAYSGYARDARAAASRAWCRSHDMDDLAVRQEWARVFYGGEGTT
jgi:hypothetical protein